MAKSKKRKQGTPDSTKKRAGTCKGKSCCNILETAMKGEHPEPVKAKKGKRPLMGATACEIQLPICPTGVACVFGRDQAQALVCYPAPTGGRQVLCGESGVIFWGAAP